jgi:hypothetical protein
VVRCMCCPQLKIIIGAIAALVIIIIVVVLI